MKSILWRWYIVTALWYVEIYNAEGIFTMLHALFNLHGFCSVVADKVEWYARLDVIPIDNVAQRAKLNEKEHHNTHAQKKDTLCIFGRLHFVLKW